MDKNTRYTPQGHVEGTLRREVRYILGLDGFARDEQIIEEIRRLKRVEESFFQHLTNTEPQRG